MKEDIVKLEEQNQYWENKCQKMYRDVKQGEIIEEKKRYELYIKVKEQNSILKKTKRDLREKDAQLDLLKQEHAVALSKKMIMETTGEGSFANFASDSVVSNTPSPLKKERNSLIMGMIPEEEENQQGKSPAAL